MTSVCSVREIKQPVFTHSDADNPELPRIRGEFLEMPGLCLTRCQAQRLWGLPCDRCLSLLAILVEEGFLRVTADGRFVRSGNGH